MDCEEIPRSKVCFKCNKEKSLSDFYLKRGKPRTYCKQCHSAQGKAHYKKNKELRNQQMRDHYKNNTEQYQKKHAEYRRSEKGRAASRKATEKFMASDKGKESLKASAKEWASSNTEKRKAHWKVKDAIRKGTMIRQACVVCGDVKSHGHHEDYGKPLEVVWLCVEHHKKLHRTVIL